MITFLETDKKLLIEAIDIAINEKETLIKSSNNKATIKKLRNDIGYLMTTQKHIMHSYNLIACN